MRQKKHTLIVLLVLGVGLALGAWWYVRERRRPVAYQTARVERGPLSRLVIATGTVNPMATVQVGTYVSGPIKELFVDFNSPVEQGQRVAKIDPAPFATRVKAAEANLANARAKVEMTRADLVLKKLTLERNRALLAKNLVSQNDVDTAKSMYDQAVAQLAIDQAAMKQTEASLQEARVNLAYTDIISPIDGVVVSRNVDVGQTVAASFQTPTLFLIAQDLTKMQVDTNVSESDIGMVQEGQRAAFLVDAYPERKFWGAVTQVRNAPQIVQNVVTYDVVVSVDNTDLALKPGMTANISIISAHRDNALKVPLAALRFRPPSAHRASTPKGQAKDHGQLGVQDADGKKDEEQRRQVWVANGQKLTPVPVQVGISDETDAELLQGPLAEGDTVVIGIRATNDGVAQTTLPGFGMRWRR